MGDVQREAEGLRADATTLLVQLVLGFLCRALFCLPYQRHTVGLAALERRRYLFVCNHVSLLDTILLGGILWSARRLPMLVLGDRDVWRATWIRRALSARLALLIDRQHLSKDVIRQLRCFGRSAEAFQLLVFPEGTRGDGVHVKECQAGVYFIAQAARVPIVPVFIDGMQHVSTKTTPFRPLGGLRKITVRFGSPWAPEEYLALEPEALRGEVRARLQALGPRT